AADQDHIGAINLLAQASKAGDQTAADPVAAFELFSRTAALGNAMGLFEVAQAHLAGSGTPVDLVQAYTYANIAAARGHPEGAALRDKVEALLTPEEVAEGQTAARDWIAADDARAKAATLEN
ncbi:MAG: tetratricopeptide repeat protein, partial [Paracoccaceae bacterium]